MHTLLLCENDTLNRKCDQSHVLVVEDRPEHVRLRQEALSDVKASVNLHVADDGVEAMAFLRHQGTYASAPRPDLILLDLNLPRMDGREVLALIKKDVDLTTVPTIILTVCDMDQDLVAGCQLHGNSYRRKRSGPVALTVVAAAPSPGVSFQGSSLINAGRIVMFPGPWCPL